MSVMIAAFAKDGVNPYAEIACCTDWFGRPISAMILVMIVNARYATSIHASHFTLIGNMPKR